MASHITRYDSMPIPPIEAHTQWFDAGAVRFGVEYRLLTDAIAAAAPGRGRERAATAPIRRASTTAASRSTCEGRDEQGALEYLRFDCFDEDPHYHYVSWRARSNEMLHIDPIADGDPLAWALERLRTRLPRDARARGRARTSRRASTRAASRPCCRASPRPPIARATATTRGALRDALRVARCMIGSAHEPLGAHPRARSATRSSTPTAT